MLRGLRACAMREDRLITQQALEVGQIDPSVDTSVITGVGLKWDGGCLQGWKGKLELKSNSPKCDSLLPPGQKSGWMGLSVWQALVSAVSTWP